MDEPRSKELGWRHLLLAHHLPPHLHHCYQWNGVYVCARCLGLYPTLIVVMTVVLAGAWRPGPPIAFRLLGYLCLPALLDWSAVRLGFWRGRNPLRTVTGVLMGVGLGVSFPYYFRDPGSYWFWAVGGTLAGAATVVEVTARYLGEP